MADRGKGKAVDEGNKRPRRGSSSRGGRRPANIPPPPPNVESREFDALFENEEIPIIEETVGGDRGASLSYSDLDGDSDLEIQIPLREAERFLDEENQRDQGNPRPSSSRSTGFSVEVEDSHGNISRRTLDLSTLTQMEGYRVLVPWNSDTDQPIGQGGHLLNRFLSEFGGNWAWFPIYFHDWRKMPSDNKNRAFADVVSKKFKLREAHKRYVVMKLGQGWKSRRLRLYTQQNGDSTMPLQQLIDNVPDGVLPNEWASYVQYRRSADAQALSHRNTRSRSHQVVNHTAGTKSFAVTYSEMQQKAEEERRQTDYGQLWTRTHRHRDGRPTSAAAEDIIARIEASQAELRASQPPESQGSVDPTAPLKAAVGPKEHPGRVKGMGLGARPSMVYGKASSSYAGTSGSKRPPPGEVDAMIAAKVAEQVAEQIAEKLAEQAAAQQAAQDAKNKRMQEEYHRWAESQSDIVRAMAGALSELMPGRHFPSPQPPPSFLYEYSPTPPPPPPPRPPPPVVEDEHEITSGRARDPPETGPDHHTPDT